MGFHLTSKSTQTEKQADHYASLLLSGDVSDETLSQVSAWKASSEENVQAFEHAMAFQAQLEVLAGDPEIQAMVNEAKAHEVKSEGKIHSNSSNTAETGTIDGSTASVATAGFWDSYRYMAAACFILAFGVFLGYFVDYNGNTNAAHYARYQTGLGEQQEVQLADGSVLTLNTNSGISVLYTEGYRSVVLNHGEVFFDVAKDPKRPFLVDTGAGTIRVVGTQFNVFLNGDTTSVAVVEGLVRMDSVSPKNTQAHAQDENSVIQNAVFDPSLEINAEASFMLAAGEGLIHKKQDDTYLKFNNQKRAQKLAGWTKGFLRFEQAPLSIIVKEMSRYSDHKIIFADDDVKQMKVNAVLQLNDVEKILSGLSTSLPVEIDTSNSEYTVIKRRKVL